VGDEPAGKRRLLDAQGNVIEMLLDGELADLGDAGVIDLDFVGRMRSRRERGAKCEERNAEPRFP
jgi:hypothetical protein